MRLLLFLILVALGLWVILPPWIMVYVRSQLWYLFSFQWLHEVKYVLRFWEWIPAQCGWDNGGGLLLVIHWALGMVWLFGHYGYTDAFLRITIGICATHCFFYAGDVVTEYVFCSSKRFMDGNHCTSVIIEGLNSVSILNWYIDSVVIQPVSVIFIFIEGWRVRMGFFKVMAYAIFAATFTQIVSLPLFLLEWRNHVRVLDVAWKLQSKTKDSWINNHARKDAAMMYSQQHTSNLRVSAAQAQSTGPSTDSPASATSSAAIVPTPVKSTITPSHHRTRSGRFPSWLSVPPNVPSFAINSPPSPTPTPTQAPLSAISSSDELPPLSPMMNNSADEFSSNILRRRHSRRSMGKKSLEFKKSQLARINTQLDGSLTDSCLGVPSSAPPVMRQRRQSESMFGGGLRRIGKRLLGPSAVEEDDDDDDSQYNSKKHHTSEIDDKIDMATLTKQFWAYGEERGTEGVPASDMINDPSPVPFRYWPTILGGKHSGIDLCIVVPILFILAGGIEFWTWWTWMDVYVRSHCWLAGFLEFAFISPSSFMMITGGWHGFFIWSTFMYCTEPAKNRKYVIYLFMQITFHNVAFGMVTYILWREFRLRYLPSSSSPDGEVSLMQGSDRSVWYSSYSPDRYFLKPKDCEPRKYIQQEVEELGKKIYDCGVAVVEWIRLPVSTVLQLTGLADLFRWLCAKVAHTFPPFAMMAHDLHRIIKETIWLNWLDIMVFIRSIIQSCKRVFSSHAPLPTPSTRRTIIDWTLFVPYVLTTWVLCLNAYVLCWCLGQNTAARLVSTWFICVVNFLYFTARSQSQVRSQWAWLSFEIDSEFTQRVSKDQSELQTIYAATGLNLLTASLSPAMSPLSPETPITPAPHMHAHAHAHSHMSTFSPPPMMMHNSTLSAPIAFSHLNASSTVNTPAMTPSPAPSESPSFISISATPTPRSGIGISNFGHAAANAAATTTRMRRRKITDLDYYRPFVWNPHVLWTFTYLGLTFLGAFILLPDMQFDLPWWSHLYADFRQNGIDGIHRGTGAGMNMPLLVISLALGFPLFFGFTIQSPKMSLGLPHMSSVMKLLFILPLVLIYGVVWDHAIEPCYTPLGMEGPPLAPEYLRQVNETITATVRQRVQPPTNNPFLTTNTALRPVHPKTHGCLEAEFTTPFFIPAKFRAGIFAVPPLPSGEVRSWKAFVRFSNGGLQKRARDGSWNVQPDSLPDVRGMSVKLLNVEGKKALDPEFLAKYPEQKTQDFVTISSPFFFAASGEGYVQDFMFFAKPSLSAFVKWFFPNELFNLSEWQKMWSKIRTLWALKQMNDDGANVYNPLDINYFSAAPFRLGDDMEKSTAQGRAAMAVKYRWKPCHIANRPGEGESPIDRVSLALRSGYRRVRNSVAALRGAPQTTARDEHLTIAEAERLTAEENPINFLRMNLQHRLDKNANHSIYTPMPFSRVKPEDDVCFILMVQDQMEPCRNKIEDCMKPWDGPWTRVGKLTIPKQNFLSSQQLEFCNNLSFNPWHALEAHRPLGQINQLRKIAYLAASEERRRLNGVNDTSVFIADYKGDELTKLGQSDHALSGEPASYSFAEYNKPYDRMPKRVAVVPYTELMSNETHIEIVKRLLMAGRSIAYPQQKLRAELTTPQDYEYFMLGRPDEAVFNNSNMAVSGRMRRPEHVAGHVWTSDSWWASQFIRGLNPMMIQLASSSNPLPWDALGGRFTPDLESQVANVLAKEKVKTLDGLIRQKRIFFIDYEEFEDISTYGDRVLYAPIIVFYLPALPNKRELMPLFIQLDRKSHIASGMRPKIFFPAPISEYYPDHMTNEGLVWLFAKMHASAADAVAHQMIYHLCETHLVLEPTIIATHRAFRADHPIMKLLSQHFTGTIAINEFGRETLLSDMHSQLDDFLSPGLQGSLQLMQKHYRGKHYRYMETVPDQIRRRGFNVERPRDAANWGTNEDELPGFVYRDYAIAIYHKFRHYVETVLKKTKYGYEPKKQQEVFDNDIQVKAWLHQLGSPTAADIPNMPPVTNFDQLVDFVTQIMFQGSAQHAAVNFAQYEYQAFQPARPLFLTRGMPVNTSIVDHSFILRSMMPMDEMVLAVGLFDILSACCVNTLMLDLSEADGYTNAKTTITPAYPDEWDELKRELRVIENEMKRYNGEKGYLYPYLYPSRIPMSAAI